METLTALLGPVSISEKTSFRKISSSLEAARFVFRIVRSLWNLTGTSAAVLPMCLSNFKAIRQFKVPISWLRDFTRSYEKTSFRILRRGPGPFVWGIHGLPVDSTHNAPIVLSFDGFFAVNLNKLLNKQSTIQRTETTLCPCDVTLMDMHAFLILLWFVAVVMRSISPRSSRAFIH